MKRKVVQRYAGGVIRRVEKRRNVIAVGKRVERQPDELNSMLRIDGLANRRNDRIVLFVVGFGWRRVFTFDLVEYLPVR